jgi:hypothetical protein
LRSGRAPVVRVRRRVCCKIDYRIGTFLAELGSDGGQRLSAEASE